MDVLIAVFSGLAGFTFGLILAHRYMVDHLAKQREKITSAKSAEIAAWEDAVRSDPEFGGSNLQANVELADRAITQYGSMGLRIALSDGMGSHPELVRFVFKVANDLRLAGMLRHD